MCREVTCNKCKRPTWAGCGRHVESVLAHVPVDQRCQCRDEGKYEDDSGGPLRKAIRAILGR